MPGVHPSGICAPHVWVPEIFWKSRLVVALPAVMRGPVHEALVARTKALASATVVGPWQVPQRYEDGTDLRGEADDLRRAASRSTGRAACAATTGGPGIHRRAAGCAARSPAVGRRHLGRAARGDGEDVTADSKHVAHGGEPTMESREVKLRAGR